jgi:chromosome partitioning protein
VLRRRRIAFINEKGGSAKTTLTVNLGAWRSAIDLLLDTVLGDPGLDGPRAGQLEPAHNPAGVLPITRTHIPNLDVIVANKSLALFPAWEGGDELDPTGSLQRTLSNAPELERYDFVLFDAPPSFGPLTMNVLRATSEIVVPVPLTFLAMDGCAELLRTIETVRTRYDHPNLRISMVVPTFYRRTRMAHEILDRLKARFPKEIAHAVVGYHVKIDEAQSRGLSVFEYAPKDRGARVMAELAEELELRDPAEPGGRLP